MLRLLLSRTNRIHWPAVQQICRQSTESTKWDLWVGIQLERLPVVSKSLNKLERDYQEMLTQVEFENSYKSDFEVKLEEDKKLSELIKAGKVEVELDTVAQQTSQDLKDLWKEERNKFQLASRTTAADQKNDRTSTNRCLEDALTLVVEQSIGNDTLALLPQGRIQDGETLRQAAERIIKEQCGDSLVTQFYGNAPCGFYKYKYPKGQRNDAVGAKVFFYRAILKTGQIDQKLCKYEWLNKEELLEKVDKHSEYKKSLTRFMI